jgi:hypothetical protein
MHNALGAMGLVRAADEQAALLLAPDLATTATVVVEGRLEVEDLAPELLGNAVPVHLKVSIGLAAAPMKRLEGSYFGLTRRD